MKIYRGLFIILLIFIANICNANDTIKKKGLHDCIMMALKNNYAIKQSKLDEMIAAMKTKEIKADLLPQINASTGLTDNMSSPVVILPGELLGIANTDIPVELVTPYELGARIDISQVIFDATLFTGIKTAKNIQELIALKKELNEEELIYNVSIIFYDILYGEQLLSNLNSNLSMQDSLYVYMSHREKQDLIRKIDLNRIKVEISNIKIQIKQLIAKIDQQKRYLKILIGSPINDALFLDNDGLEDINLPVDLEREQLQILNIKEVEVLNKQKKNRAVSYQKY